jgi:hypothetical protein
MGGVAYVSLLYHGQSFMLHQIRKMTTMVAAAVSGALDAPGGRSGSASSAASYAATPIAGLDGAAGPKGGMCEEREGPHGISAAARAAMAHALNAPRVPNIPKAPSCALVLRRCWYRHYESKRPQGRASVEFAEAEDDRAAFIEAKVLPHIVEREREGEFRIMQNDVARYRLSWRVEAGHAERGREGEEC